jgi:hypothetical protein
MSVNLHTLESKFKKAKIEYKTLMETIKTSCLGNQYDKECHRAKMLNNEMQNYLLDMSALVKPIPPKRKEFMDLAFQLEEDMTLLQQESDGQTLASMNYSSALTWGMIAITVVGVLLYKN